MLGILGPRATCPAYGSSRMVFRCFSMSQINMMLQEFYLKYIHVHTNKYYKLENVEYWVFRVLEPSWPAYGSSWMAFRSFSMV